MLFRSEWGDGVYGIEAASREYFGIPASALNPTQAALLAGAFINPRVLTPQHPTPRLKRRQQIILARMGGRSTAPIEQELRRREPKPPPEKDVPLDALDELPPVKEEPPQLPPESEAAPVAEPATAPANDQAAPAPKAAPPVESTTPPQ